MTRVAIIAAMPGELKPLVRGWRHERRNNIDLWHWRFDEGEWVAACAGAGADAAVRAYAEIEKDGPVSLVVSSGWAGALKSELEPGRAYIVSSLIDARTGERFRAAQWSEERLAVTSPKVADAAEKLRLAAAYGADLVDMEGAAVARLADMRGIPFYCIKGVSDGLSDRLPDFNRFLSPGGGFRYLRFIFFVLFRPTYWLALLRMGENSKKASQSIAEMLLDLLDERGQIRKRNGYPNFRP